MPILFSQWKFDQLDRKHDDELDSRDLKEFRYALMPLEHCADDFFQMCDEDHNNRVSYEEWVDCLMVSTGCKNCRWCDCKGLCLMSLEHCADHFFQMYDEDHNSRVSYEK